MKRVLHSLAVLSALAACAEESGVGFEHYEVPQTTTGVQVTSIQWRTLRPVPRYRVQSAGTAEIAAAVQPLTQAPEAGVASVTLAGARLRLVEDPSRVWLVAETSQPPIADTPGLRTEAAQRSGCLVEGATRIESGLVFALNCL